MRLNRKNPSINDAVETLDNILYECSNDSRLAWSRVSRETQTFIDEELYKCASNPRYYLENYHVIMTEDEGIKTLYPFWDSQEMFYFTIETFWKHGKPVRLLVLKARQLGSSTISEGLCFHKTIFTEGVNTLIVAQDPVTADHQFSMSRTAYDNLPWWMRPEERYQAKGRYLWFDKKDDLERQLHPGLKSKIIVEAANKMTSPGRGQTFRCAHFSELGEWQDGGVLSQSILPTMNARDGLYIMESTAKGRTGFWYRFWRDVVEGKVTDWEPLFIPFYQVRKYSRPLKEGVAFVLDKEELGIRDKILKRDKYFIKDESFNWVRAKKQEFITLEGDEFRFYQEYPLGWQEAFQGTGLCAFPKKKLQNIMDSQCAAPGWVGEIYFDLAKQPKDRIKVVLSPIRDGQRVPMAKTEGARLRVWERPEPGVTYYLAADVAHGIDGGDFSCVQILKIGQGPQPDEQVAEWHGWINPTPFAHVVAALGFWYNEAQIAVECNDVGMTTQNELFRVIEYENLYRWKHLDKVKNFITDFMGWYTNSKTRDTIISKCREAIMDGSLVLRNEDLVDQMLDFSSDEGSRFEGQNSNDDRVMAMMICRYCAHDSDWGKEAMGQSRSSSAAGPQRAERILIYDEMNRLRYNITSREDGETLARQPGWSMKVLPSPRDFANTEFSPVHDKAGIRRDLYYEHGVPAEMIKDELLMYAQMGRATNEDDFDWRSV